MKSIRVTNLSAGFSERLVLKNASFSAGKGEFVAIVGKSGAGKTTFLNALAGFIECNGTIRLGSKAGFVFQNYSLFPWLTVEQNIEFGIKREPPAVRKEIVGRYLKLIDLGEHSKKYPRELSGGQVQRVAIARAFASNPDIVLMDEPFGALDVFTRDKMQKWLLELWEREGKTIVFVTHYIDEALFLADRVLVLRDGGFKEQISLAFPRPRNDEIKFGERFGLLKKRILRAIN